MRVTRCDGRSYIHQIQRQKRGICSVHCRIQICRPEFLYLPMLVCCCCHFGWRGIYVGCLGLLPDSDCDTDSATLSKQSGAAVPKDNSTRLPALKNMQMSANRAQKLCTTHPYPMETQPLDLFELPSHPDKTQNNPN